ncbi:hypothetical protein SEPCBS119000_004841 [Sporothrix epigloea]|uniref:F-box domain-containing protein n=1 Tax=Sporothrix epigloea TaxID=1892477 RepID=A0ABP0DUC0_9PEZI
MALVQAESPPALGPDRLSRLPAELLLRITRDLTTTELCAVRLCSRALESSLRHFFLLEFFQHKQFMLTDFSLQTLLAIARHPAISQTLRHVSIGAEEFCVNSRFVPQNEDQDTSFFTAAAQQQALLASGRALHFLAAAFSLLPNLETVQLSNTPSYTQFCEGPRAAWHSYGLRSTCEQLGKGAHRLLKKSTDPDFSSRAFAMVMTALAQSDARPANIKVSMHSKVAGLKDYAFDLAPVPRLSLPGVSAGNDTDVDTLAILAGLRQLHLKLQFVLHPHRTRHIVPDDPPFSGRSKLAAMESLALHAWLAHCPKVEWLRLNLHKEPRHYNDFFLRRLGSPLPAYYPLPPGSIASRDITMPFASHLRRLDLGIACCSVDVLLDLLDRFPALEYLSLYRFSLMFEKDKAETAHNIWSKFLRALVESPLGVQLKELSLRRLGTVTRYFVYPYSKKTHTLKLNGSDGIKYTAELDKPMISWLRKIPFELIQKGSSVDADLEFFEDNSNYLGGNDTLSEHGDSELEESDTEDGF